LVKVHNVFGDRYSGKVGKAGVFATWKGRQYRRSWVKPANPKSPAQQTVRNNFKNAVAEWHDFNALQKAAYGYLATPEQISGFNLWVRRYQKAATSGQTLPTKPKWGIKQIGTAYTSQSTTLAAGQGPATLTGPIQIGSVSFDAGSSGLAVDAIVYINAGLIVFPSALSGTVTIDYKAGGKTVTGKQIATNPAAGDTVQIDDAPINFESVKIYLDGSQVESLEIDEANGKAYFDKTGPSTSDASLDYVSYTPLANAKLELYKSGTNTIAWRGYSDAGGFLEVAATVEDAPYDMVITAANYSPVSRVAVSAEDATKDELIIMS